MRVHEQSATNALRLVVANCDRPSKPLAEKSCILDAVARVNNDLENDGDIQNSELVFNLFG